MNIMGCCNICTVYFKLLISKCSGYLLFASITEALTVLAGVIVELNVPTCKRLLLTTSIQEKATVESIVCNRQQFFDVGELSENKGEDYEFKIRKTSFSKV